MVAWSAATMWDSASRWTSITERRMSSSCSTLVMPWSIMRPVVYIISLITSAVTLVVGILLVAAAFRIIRKYVLTPMLHSS